MKIALIDSKLDNPNIYITNEIYKAFVLKLGAENVYLCSYSDLNHKLKEEDIELLLILDGGEIFNPVIAQACKLVKYSYCWRFDDPYDMQSLELTQNWFDHVFTNDAKTGLDTNHISYLPLSGFLNSNSNLIRLENRMFDLLYVGTNWPNRTPYMKILENLDQKYTSNLISNHIEFEKNQVFNYTNGFNFFPRIGISDYKFLLKNSKIVVSLGRDFSVGVNNRSISAGLPPRVFEAMSYGCIQITDKIISESLGYADFLTLNRCDGAEHLENLIHKLMKDLNYQSRLVSKDLITYNENHTYLNRVEVILETHAKLLEKNSKPLISKSEPFKILHVNQNDLKGSINPLGGSDYWLKSILEDEELGHTHFLFSPTGNLTGYQITESDKILQLESDPFTTQWDIRNRQLEKSFTKYILDNDIDLVHFNHLLNIPLSLISICKFLGVQTVTTWHDYFGLCPIFTLYNHRTGYCGYLEDSNVNHHECLDSFLGLGKGAWERRKWVMSYLISEIPTHIFPSKFVLDSYINSFPSIISQNKVIISPPLPILENFPKRIPKNGSKRKYIAFIGNLTAHKGSAYIKLLLNEIDKDKYQILLLGHLSPNDFGVEELELKGPFNYSPENYHNLLNFIDEILVVIAISSWPETYQITVDEITSLGIPVIVSNLGAPKDRAKSNNLIFPVDSAIPVAELYKIITDLEQINPKINSNNFDSEFKKKMKDFYSAFFIQNKRRNKRNISILSDEIYNYHNIIDKQVLLPFRWN